MAAINFRNRDGKKFSAASLMKGISQTYFIHRGCIYALLDIYESFAGEEHQMFPQSAKKCTNWYMRNPEQELRAFNVSKSASSEWTLVTGNSGNSRTMKMRKGEYYTVKKGQISTTSIPDNTTFFDVTNKLEERINWTKTAEKRTTRVFEFVDEVPIDPNVGADFKMTTRACQAFVVNGTLFTVPHRWKIDENKIPQLYRVEYYFSKNDDSTDKTIIEKKEVKLTSFKENIGNLKAIWTYRRSGKDLSDSIIIDSQTQVIFTNGKDGNKILVREC